MPVKNQAQGLRKLAKPQTLTSVTFRPVRITAPVSTNKSALVQMCGFQFQK